MRMKKFVETPKTKIKLTDSKNTNVYTLPAFMRFKKTKLTSLVHIQNLQFMNLKKEKSQVKECKIKQ